MLFNDFNFTFSNYICNLLRRKKGFFNIFAILILYFQRIINYAIVENSLLNNNSYDMMSFDIS